MLLSKIKHPILIIFFLCPTISYSYSNSNEYRIFSFAREYNENAWTYEANSPEVQHALKAINSQLNQTASLSASTKKAVDYGLSPDANIVKTARELSADDYSDLAILTGSMAIYEGPENNDYWTLNFTSGVTMAYGRNVSSADYSVKIPKRLITSKCLRVRKLSNGKVKKVPKLECIKDYIKYIGNAVGRITAIQLTDAVPDLEQQVSCYSNYKKNKKKFTVNIFKDIDGRIRACYLLSSVNATECISLNVKVMRAGNNCRINFISKDKDIKFKISTSFNGQKPNKNVQARLSNGLEIEYLVDSGEKTSFQKDIKSKKNISPITMKKKKVPMKFSNLTCSFNSGFAKLVKGCKQPEESDLDTVGIGPAPMFRRNKGRK